jgi:hypothetical protein
LSEQAAGGIREGLYEVEKLKAERKNLDNIDKMAHRQQYEMED